MNTITLEIELALLKQSLIIPRNSGEMKQRAINKKIRQTESKIESMRQYIDLHERVGYGK